MPQRSRPDDPEVLRLVAEGARVGMTYELIAKHAGIAPSSLYKWAKLGREGSEEHKAFAEALDSNETRGALSCLARIHKAAQGGDWKAAAWLMERRHGYTSNGALALQQQEDRSGEHVDVWELVRKAVQLAPHRVKQIQDEEAA